MLTVKTLLKKRAVWYRFGHGESITDLELLDMIYQSRKAVEYTQARGAIFELATNRILTDLSTLIDYARARGLEIPEEDSL